MTPEDFSQFPDPRVRAVFAAAANLCATIASKVDQLPLDVTLAEQALMVALFAAQHSQPKTRTIRVEPPCAPCLLVDEADARAHGGHETTRNMTTPESQEFWVHIKKCAAIVDALPAWQKAGININPEQYETYPGEARLHGEKIIAQRTAAQEEANKFALLANDIVMAAEKWWSASFVGEKFDGAGPITEEARMRNPGWGCGTDDEYALAVAVAAYRKARSEDERR